MYMEMTRFIIFHLLNLRQQKKLYKMKLIICSWQPPAEKISTEIIFCSSVVITEKGVMPSYAKSEV